MSTDLNSRSLLRPACRNSPAENIALSRYPQIEDLLAAVERALINLGRADEPPASLADGNHFFQLLSEVGSEWICAKLPRVSAASLWFIVAAYLEARQEPRCWYELSDDHADHLVWVFSLEERPHEDEFLTRRELVLAYLTERNGWAPA